MNPTRKQSARIKYVPTPAAQRSAPPPVTLTFTFQVSSWHAPALLSAIHEISNEVAGRLEGAHLFSKEEALTKAAAALGILRAAIHQQVSSGDPDYE